MRVCSELMLFHFALMKHEFISTVLSGGNTRYRMSLILHILYEYEYSYCKSTETCNFHSGSECHMELYQ